MSAWVTPEKPNLIRVKKETPAQEFTLWICENFKNTIIEHPRVTVFHVY